MERTYKPRILPVVNEDFWMTMIRASAAIGYVCQGSPGSIQQPPTCNKTIYGHQYSARVVAVSPTGATMTPDNQAHHFAFEIVAVDNIADETSIRKFEDLLIDKFDEIEKEGLPVSLSVPKDFQVHKPSCHNVQCDGCDEG